MSNVGLRVAETVVAFALLVTGVYCMKRKGLLKEADGAVFSKLLIQAVLPATIFYQLWTHRLSGATVVPVLIMFLTGVVALAASWLAGCALKFDRQSTGAGEIFE